MTSYPDDSSNDVFLTPLKKLPTSFGQNINTPIKSLTTNQTPKRYNSILNQESNVVGRTHIPTKINQQYDLINSNDLTPLNDLQLLKFSQTIPHKKFVDDDEINGKKPPIIYYKPPNASSQYGFKSLLPPNFNKLEGKFKNPIVVTPEPPKQSDDNEDYPTGDWFNPVVKVALSRQINKEQYFKKFAVNLVLFVGFKLAQAIFSYFRVVIDANFGNSQESKYKKIMQTIVQENEVPWADGIPAQWYLKLVLKAVEAIFIINIVYCGYKLVKKQNQCFDLPLNNKQRQLLGLEVNGHYVNEDEKERDLDVNTNLLLKQRQFRNSQPEDVSITLPKYSRSNQYSKAESRPVPVPDTQIERKIELDTRHSLGLYNRKIISSNGPVLVVDKPAKVSDKLQEKFHRKYNIEFNVSDDDRIDTTNVLGSL